jgi:hypothetical protein
MPPSKIILRLDVCSEPLRRHEIIYWEETGASQKASSTVDIKLIRYEGNMKSSNNRKMKPTIAPSFDQTGETPVRQVFCLDYGECLQGAIDQNWPSFTCSECLNYRPPKWELTMLLEDALCCSKLLSEAMNPRRRIWETRDELVRRFLTKESNTFIFEAQKS